MKLSSPSLASLARLSFPLMITAASESLMLFADRAFLARYELNSMNAAAAIWMSTALVIYSIIALCAIAEVLAGQYNGQEDKTLVARPIWQMIWFALGSSCITLPLAFFGKPYFVAPELIPASGHFFELFLSFAPVWGINVALAGFFAATGRPAIVTFAAIPANLINIVLGYFLIFGWGPIPELGIDGAAIATLVGQATQLAILGVLFFRKQERLKFGTARLVFSKKDFLRCLRIGLPSACNNGVEIAAWALLFPILSSVSTAHVTALSVSQSIAMLFGFINTGIKQAVIAFASNLLGAAAFDKMHQLLRSGFIFQLLFMAGLAVPMLIAPELGLALLGGVKPEAEAYSQLCMALRFSWGFCLFDGLVWVLAGMMTAGGDTRVPFLINVTTVWLLVIAPCWYFIARAGADAWYVQMFMCLYGLVNFIGHILRFRCNKWRVQIHA